MSRFLYSSTTLKRFGTCPASFELMQTGAARGDAGKNNLRFGIAFHRVMELYVSHCIARNRHSDISIVEELIARAIRETGLSTDSYDELWLVLESFLKIYRIDHEHSISREGGIAFDDQLRVLPWSDSLEYENLTRPVDQKGNAFLRMKLDHVLLYPETKILKVQDYKSDLFVPSKSAIQLPSSRFYQQARIYAWGAHRGIFPADLVEVEFVFARFTAFGKVRSRTLTFNRDELDQTQDMLMGKTALIEATTTFEAKAGDHCNLCEFRDTACPLRGEISLELPENRMNKFLFLTVQREHLREQLKDDVAELGFDGVLGPLKAGFDEKESLVADMERLVAALQAEGVENPWAVMNLSKTEAERVLDKDVCARVLKAAYDSDVTTRFNVHQNKEVLVDLAESRGIATKGLKVSELALALARVAEEPLPSADLPIPVDLSSIVELAP